MVDGYSRICLGHYLGEARDPQMTATYYAIHYSSVARPASGFSNGATRCGTCDEEITFRVASSVIARQRKRRWLWAAIVMMLGLAAMLYQDIAFVASGKKPELDFFLLCIGTAGVAGLMCVCWWRWRREDGVRSPEAPVLPWVRKSHRLMVP